MRAFICDICRQFFTSKSDCIDPAIRVTKCHEPRFLDLCPECQKKLENFIKEGEFK